MPTNNLLKNIEESWSRLRRSEQKVASFVLEHPGRVIHLSIADLANLAMVSEPTVLRFCRALGYEGFQDFKLKFAQSLASDSHFSNAAINRDDSLEEYKLKIFNSAVNTLITIRDQLNTNQLEEAIQALTTAQRIVLYGFGASGAVAIDGQYSFLRLKIHTVAYSDPYVQTMSVATLTDKDVVIAISQSGQTKELANIVQQALKQNAHVICLSPPNTPISDLSDIPLYLDARDITDIFSPLTARVAQLATIDVLAMGAALARGTAITQK